MVKDATQVRLNGATPVASEAAPTPAPKAATPANVYADDKASFSTRPAVKAEEQGFIASAIDTVSDAASSTKEFVNDQIQDLSNTIKGVWERMGWTFLSWMQDERSKDEKEASKKQEKANYENAREAIGAAKRAEMEAYYEKGRQQAA